MEHFVTLFDSLFLPQGLALHNSMERHIQFYILWVLCVDDEVYDSLSKFDLPNVRLLKLSELETEELLAVKPTRDIGEYCWTLTPFAPRFVFEADARINRVTYLDADMWFRKNPAPIFREFDASRKDVLITNHNFAPEYDQSENSGQYCVQFITFTRVGGEVVRKWWEERCVEWCFNRFEEGKFGDQKYLDDWPERFKNEVHELQNKELLLAPWNATRFPYGSCVAWHFHALRIMIGSPKSIYIEFGPYCLPKPTQKNVYGVYISNLRDVIEKMIRFNVKLIPQEIHTIKSQIKMRFSASDKRIRLSDVGFLEKL